MDTISITKAKKIILASQKLNHSRLKPQAIIEHLGYVQIDTISVVERAHHHVFWSRNTNYKPSDLDELVRTRKVFEYWSHAASYLPMCDYRFSLPMKRDFQSKSNYWFPRDAKMMSKVLARIKTEGPLRSQDFKTIKKNKAGWWDWKPAKKALERLFLEGQLEITERQGFQKVYDLPQNVIPSCVDTSMPTDDEYCEFIIKRILRHHGIASLEEMAYLKNKASKDKIYQKLLQMYEEGEVVRVKIKNLESIYYAFRETMNKTITSNNKIHILSPFDNLVIQRKKLQKIFNYNYQIECYVPASKRKYGYFCLPIFKGHRAIARIDCKADRKNKCLIVHSLHFEEKCGREAHFSKIEKKLKQFAKFNGCLF